MGKKTIYFTLDESGHLDGYSSTPSPNPEEISLEVEENHEVLRNPFIFKYENGELIKDVEYQQQLIREREAIESQPTVEERIQIIQAALDELILGGT
ncbi:hypothetical protein Cdeb_02731 [Caldibacillus debilis GB1]|uniref:Uncharacterized protein n=1 Tax=Caldibacillus debilis GB1 TaxID=1339248 RepID=A0A420VJ13_9BACI|nr:hypothetical protein Cdeb_02731 [Caldibacillus debilis GB1]